MRCAGVWLPLWVALVACSSGKDSPTSTRPGVDEAPNLGVIPPTERVEDEDDEGDDDSTYLDTPDDDWGAPTPSPPAPGVNRPAADPEAAQAAPEAEEPERDLGEELVGLLRPDACLDLKAGSVTPDSTLQIHVQAMAMPSGRLQRASVEVAGQPADARACLVKQVESGRLAPPIEGAPLRVSGTLEMEVQSAPGPTSAAGN